MSARGIAAATSYTNTNQIMIPFYIYYSMFGFQRIGDLRLGRRRPARARLLLGGTAGRTTLNGEGLQHEDGHSQPSSPSTIPVRLLRSDYAYELAVIMDASPQTHERRSGRRVLLHHPDE